MVNKDVYIIKELPADRFFAVHICLYTARFGHFRTMTRKAVFLSCTETPVPEISKKFRRNYDYSEFQAYGQRTAQATLRLRCPRNPARTECHIIMSSGTRADHGWQTRTALR